MKQLHRKPAGAALLGGFDIVNGTPPGPSDPDIFKDQPFPKVGCPGPRMSSRPTRHCRVLNR